MAVNNSAKSSPSFCLICIQCISDQQIHEIHTSLMSRPLLDLENIIQVFCDYMDFKTIRFGSYKACPGPGEIFPYCKTCLEQILELYEFHEGRKRLTDLIAKSVCSFTAKIIENPLESLKDIKLYWSTRKSTNVEENNTDSLLSIDEIKTEKDDLDLSLQEENLEEDDPCIKVGSVTQPPSLFLNEWIDLRKEIIKRYSVEVSVSQTTSGVPVPVPTMPIQTKSMIPVAFEEHITTTTEENSEFSTNYEFCKQELDEDVHEDYFSDADRSECDIESNLSRPIDSDFDGNDGASDFDLGTERIPKAEAEAADDVDVDITDLVDPLPTVLRKSQRIRNKNNGNNSMAEDDNQAADFVALPIALRKPQRRRRELVLLPKVKDDVKLDPNWNPPNFINSIRRSEREAGQNLPEPKPRLVKKISPNQFAVGDFTFEKVDNLYKCGSCEHSTANRPNIVCHIKTFHLNPRAIL